MKNMRWVAVILTVTLFFGPSASADEALNAQVQKILQDVEQMKKSYEARISDLESQVMEFKAKEQAVAGAPATAPSATAAQKGIDFDYVGRQQGPFQKGGLIARDSSGFANVSVGGYADIELENFKHTHSAFDQHRWIINIGAELGERLRFFSEYEIEHGGPSVGGEAKVEQAWIDFLINDLINFRAGALLVPFGRYNLYHDSDLQDLTDRPLLARDVIPTTWTEAGAGIHGGFKPKIGNYEDLELGYELYFVNGLDTGFSDTGLRGARGSLGGDNNNEKSIVGRIVASPALGHEIGISGYIGDINGHDNDIKGVGVDFLTTWGPLELLGEYAYFAAEEADVNVIGSVGDIANYFQGMYIQANYHFWFDFLNDTFLGRTFDNPTFTLVGRYGWARIDDDGDVPTGLDNEEHRWTIGINYRPVESWVLKLEYQNSITEAEPLERGETAGWIASIAMGF